DEGAVVTELVGEVGAMRHALAERPRGQPADASAVERRRPDGWNGLLAGRLERAGGHALVRSVGTILGPGVAVADVVPGDGVDAVVAAEAVAAEVLVRAVLAVHATIAEQPAGERLGGHHPLLGVGAVEA